MTESFFPEVTPRPFDEDDYLPTFETPRGWVRRGTNNPGWCTRRGSWADQTAPSSCLTGFAASTKGFSCESSSVSTIAGVKRATAPSPTSNARTGAGISTNVSLRTGCDGASNTAPARKRPRRTNRPTRPMATWSRPWCRVQRLVATAVPRCTWIRGLVISGCGRSRPKASCGSPWNGRTAGSPRPSPPWMPARYERQLFEAALCGRSRSPEHPPLRQHTSSLRLTPTRPAADAGAVRSCES